LLQIFPDGIASFRTVQLLNWGGSRHHTHMRRKFEINILHFQIKSLLSRSVKCVGSTRSN
jgi:hypothetical protein